MIGGALGGIVGAVGYIAYIAGTGKEFNSTHFWMATGGGAVAGALIGTGVGAAEGLTVAGATTAAVEAGAAVEGANVACGGDMCASEVQEASQATQEMLPAGEEAVASDWAQLSGQLRDAAAGKGNFGIGEATMEQANAMGDAWVGEGATTLENGIKISSDGLRQFRPPSYKPFLDMMQANLEYRLEGMRRWLGNAHIDIIDE